MRGSNGLTLPFSASTDSAPATSAAANTRSADEQGVERDRGRGLGAVDQRQPFLGAELERLACRAARAPRAAGRIVAGEVDPAVAHQRRDQMRERGEVARGADAALAGISGMASASSRPAARR